MSSFTAEGVEDCHYILVQIFAVTHSQTRKLAIPPQAKQGINIGNYLHLRIKPTKKDSCRILYCVFLVYEGDKPILQSSIPPGVNNNHFHGMLVLDLCCDVWP